MPNPQTSLFNPQNERFVLFDETSGVRRERYNDEWRYSVVDIVAILTNTKSNDKGAYRRKLKQRLGEEWSEVVTICHELKFLATDGKKYRSDAGNTAIVLRIIQSIPSPKAEPLKRRLASLWNERFQELNNPELWIIRARERAIASRRTKGWTDEQIQLRLQSITTRNRYTDEFKKRGIQGKEYAVLTNIGYGRTGMKAQDLRHLKGLHHNENLRDNMTTHEILLTQLQEETSKKLMVKKSAQGFNQVAQCVDKGSEVAKKTKEHIEELTGEKIVSSGNFLTENQEKNKLK